MLDSSERHPRGLAVLYLTEVWERFSFYGMKALLVLYLNDGVLSEERFSKVLGSGLVVYLFGQPEDAQQVQQLSSALNELYAGVAYLTPLAGGLIADGLLGARTTLLLGGVLMAAGHACMAFEPFFLCGLVLLVLGNGGFKPTITAMLSKLYEPPGPTALRDRGFAIFYTGINVGALLAPIICGALQQSIGYDAGFGAAGIGMVVGLLTFLAGSPWLRHPPSKAERRVSGEDGLATPLVPSGGSTSPTHEPLEEPLLPQQWSGQSMLALLGLCGCVVPFWVPFEQLSNVVPLFFRHQTDRRLFGFLLPAAWLQAANPIVCVLCMPLLTSLWARQARRGAEPSPTSKMAIGCGLQSISWLLMSLGSIGVSTEDKAPLLLPFCCTLLLTLGQLYLAPIGLALVSKSCPQHARSTAVGFWFLAGGIGGLLAGPTGALYSRIPPPAFFAMLSAISVCASLLMVSVAPRLQRWAEASPVSAAGKVASTFSV